MRLLFVALIFGTTLIAAEKEPPLTALIVRAAQLTQAMLKESKGPLTDEQFCEVAIALLKVLGGKPRADEEPTVRIMKGADEGKIIVFAAYPQRPNSRRYHFTFIKKSGALDRALWFSYERTQSPTVASANDHSCHVPS